MAIAAQYGIIVILSAFLVFHFLILLKIVPYSLVWGGRLKSDGEMYRFEMVSILINLFCLFIVLAHLGTLTFDIPKKLTILFLWIITLFFTLNIFGNIKSKNKFEQKIFTPIAFILVIFFLIFIFVPI